MSYQAAAKAESVWEGELMPLSIGGKNLFLARLGQEVRAFEDRCPHQAVALSEGWLDGSRLTCRAHQWEFDLTTGRGLNPENACLTAFPVKVENGWIYVDPEAREAPR